VAPSGLPPITRITKRATGPTSISQVSGGTGGDILAFGRYAMRRKEEASMSAAGRNAPVGARVIVVGGGFAGGSFLRNLPALLRRPGECLLVSPEAHHDFVPLAHEVAVGRVHPDSARIPLAVPAEGRGLLRARATGVDLESRILRTTAGEVRYRYLVLAPGSVAARPPEGSADHLQPFWNLDDALRLRSALNEAWRAALRGDDSPGALTVGIVGGGATGVELAAEVAVLFDYLRGRAYRKPAAEPRVVLFEATDRLMAWLDPYFHEVAMEELARLGVEVRLNEPVRGADAGGIETASGYLPARVRVWAAGVEANPLVRDLPGEHDRTGRVRVDERLTLPDHGEVYVLGDNALHRDPRSGRGLPPVASFAVQQGPYAARDLGLRLRGRAESERRPFSPFDRGYLVSLGPESGVGIALGRKVRGAAAQALYRGVFLLYERSLRGRLLTGADWALERLGRVGFDSQTADRPATASHR
jgi:NADH dehydrogenase